jgi:hypothetical protein
LAQVRDRKGLKQAVGAGALAEQFPFEGKDSLILLFSCSF